MGQTHPSDYTHSEPTSACHVAPKHPLVVQYNFTSNPTDGNHGANIALMAGTKVHLPNITEATSFLSRPHAHSGSPTLFSTSIATSRNPPSLQPMQLYKPCKISHTLYPNRAMSGAPHSLMTSTPCKICLHPTNHLLTCPCNHLGYVLIPHHLLFPRMTPIRECPCSF